MTITEDSSTIEPQNMLSFEAQAKSEDAKRGMRNGAATRQTTMTTPAIPSSGPGRFPANLSHSRQVVPKLASSITSTGMHNENRLRTTMMGNT